MFPKKKLYILATIVLIVWTLYVITNREHFIREHLSNKNPTLASLQLDIDSVNKELQELKTDYQSLKQQGQAQSSQAAAAAAALQAIPAASPNTIIPTR
jgi:chromosome segregation ATPase